VSLYILCGMGKRLVDIDDRLLEQARKILGAATMKDTVNRSLAEVVKADLRRRHAGRLVDMDGLELDDPDVMDGAWR
jgi:Arc/MetJ family transcription regulator